MWYFVDLVGIYKIDKKFFGKDTNNINSSKMYEEFVGKEWEFGS